MFIFFCVPSSVQQPSATLSKYEFYSTRSFCLYCVICTISRIGIFWFFYSSSIYFFVALISRVVCWTYSHHCQIADMKPSKGSWNGQFRGFRICVGWISTTRFVLWVFMFPTNFILFCVSSISASIFHGYHAEGYHAPSLPPRAITPVYASRLSRHSIFLFLGYHT